MVEFARWDSSAELTDLWTRCFQELLRPVRFFFRNIFKPENCLVYRVEGRAVAMVHFLPAFLSEGQNQVQAHYIYAAATLPEYRGHGHMAALLKAAAEAGRRRGDRYSIVLPADAGLYRFYEKAGYARGFSILQIELTKEELEDLAAEPNWMQLPDFPALNQMRTEALFRWEKSVLWSDTAFANAVGLYQIYGGRLICIKESKKWAYALCRMRDSSCCEVNELMAVPSTLPKLAARILHELPASRYAFRLPPKSELFEKPGTIRDFGMWRALDETCESKACDGSYLGLALD